MMAQKTAMDQSVLIIDGHPVYAAGITAFLKTLAFKNMRLAQTGKQGLRDAREKRPELVILNAVLPDMDGLDVCTKIRESTAPSSKIIVQVGLSAEAKTIQKFCDGGASAVLARKEKDLTPLQKTIEELLSPKSDRPSRSFSSS